jgi:hypothetical protein
MKNIVTQHQLEQWGEEEGKEITFLEKTKQQQQKNRPVEDFLGNEENGYQFLSPTKQC